MQWIPAFEGMTAGLSRHSLEGGNLMIIGVFAGIHFIFY